MNRTTKTQNKSGRHSSHFHTRPKLISRKEGKGEGGREEKKRKTEEKKKGKKEKQGDKKSKRGKTWER